MPTHEIENLLKIVFVQIHKTKQNKIKTSTRQKKFKPFRGPFVTIVFPNKKVILKNTSNILQIHAEGYSMFNYHMI